MEEPRDIEPVTLGTSGHALNNSLILRNIFEHLTKFGSLEDLKNARLVSSAENWQKELRKVWRKEAVLVLRDGPIVESEDEQLGFGVTQYEYHWEFINPNSYFHLAEVPYERVKLVDMRIPLKRLDVEGPVQDFWDTVGSSIKHLKMLCVRLIASRPRETSWFLSAKMPNLESLFMEDSFVEELDNDERKEELPPHGDLLLPKLSSLESIDSDMSNGEVLDLNLADLPNLQKIKLEEWSQLHTLLGHTSGSDEAVVVNSEVKDLDLWEWYPQDLDAAPAAHFTLLKTLKTKLNPVEFMRTHFIGVHAATLVKLETFRGIGSAPPMNPINRKFPVLTELRLWGNVETDLSFLRFTPNLQLLHMDLYGFEKQEEMKREIEDLVDPLSLTTSAQLIGDARENKLMDGVVLRKLEYCQINCELTQEDVKALAKWMPHLKTLKTVLDSAAFLEVCAQWKELEHLECLFGSSIADWDIAPPECVYETPKLTDLKMLKSFNYYQKCNGYDPLTDKCVKGFLNLPQLTHLQIPVSLTFSGYAEDKLGEHIQNVKVDHQGVHEDLQRKCCRNTEYKRFISKMNVETDTESDADDDDA